MAQTLARVASPAARSHQALCSLLSKRFLSTVSVTVPPSPPALFFSRRSVLPLTYQALHSINSTHSRFTSVRCRVTRSGGAPYSPLNSGSNFSERPPNEFAPLFPGCDYEHWLIVMDQAEIGSSKQEMIDCYIKTLAIVLGSEEEAKAKIYNVSCERYFGFGCELDEETANKLEGKPGVLFVLPDSYVDAENKDYGAELFVNGEIVQRSPERQRRVEPQQQRFNDRPRYNDRTRYTRRRQNMR